MKLDLYSCIEAEQDDGYAKIKKRLLPEEDIDYQKLVDEGFYLWSTNLADISISYTCGNIITIKVTDDNDYSGQCSTYDFEEYGLVCCIMSALRSYLKDIDETFVNTPT